jgi:hypothetical protein
MTALPIPHEEQVPVEKESEGAGHDVIPNENAVRLGPRDPAAKPESSFQRDPSLSLGMTKFRRPR